MGVHLSIKAKLVLAASDGKELKSAMEEFNRACNTLSELAFQRDLHRKYDIHHEGYRLIREETESSRPTCGQRDCQGERRLHTRPE